MRYYEGMFLFDPAAASNWENIQAELDRLMDRAGARLIVSSKWDDRRLAYEIRGCKRGVYALTYFTADASKIKSLERDAELSESILRYMVLRADHLTEEDMKKVADQNVEKPDESAAGGKSSAKEQAAESSVGKKQQADAAKEASSQEQAGQGEEASVEAEASSSDEKSGGESEGEQQ